MTPSTPTLTPAQQAGQAMRAANDARNVKEGRPGDTNRSLDYWHGRGDHGNGPITNCPECVVETYNPNSLYWHLRGHHDQDSLTCPECDVTPAPPVDEGEDVEDSPETLARHHARGSHADGLFLGCPTCAAEPVGDTDLFASMGEEPPADAGPCVLLVVSVGGLWRPSCAPCGWWPVQTSTAALAGAMFDQHAAARTAN